MRNNQVIRLDNEDLDNLKNKFLNTSGYKSSPFLPNISIVNDQSEYKSTKLGGLSFPLKIKDGSLSLSYNEDRVKEQILEILQTQIGERVYRQGFGTPNLVFESISESVSESYIRTQLERSIRVPQISYNVRVSILNEGKVLINVNYTMGNKSANSVSYVVI